MVSPFAQKQAAIVACLNALTPLESLDFSPMESKEALSNALQAICSYPRLEIIKRRVHRKFTLDACVVAIEKDLRLCIAGEGTILVLCAINAALADALIFLQKELCN